MIFTSRSSVFNWRAESGSPKDNLHLYVTDISADIFPDKNGGSPPDSYVCLVSSPEEILSQKPTKLKQWSSAIKKAFRVSESTKVDIDSDATSKGWPRSAVIKDDYNPDWQNREIHCIMRTHKEDGFPIKLEGAILHIFCLLYTSPSPRD